MPKQVNKVAEISFNYPGKNKEMIITQTANKSKKKKSGRDIKKKVTKKTSRRLAKADILAAAKNLKKINKLPAVIEGNGYKLVNLNSAAEAQLWVKSATVGNALLNWDSTVFPYNMLHRLTTGLDAAIPLVSILGSENFVELEGKIPELYKDLQKTVLARRQIIDGLLKENKPIPFEMLTEALHPHIGKHLLFKQANVEFYGKLQSVQLAHSFMGTFLDIRYTVMQWDEGKLHSKINRLAIRPREPMTLEEWGIVLSPPAEKLAALLERGRKVLTLNETCGYVNIQGNITYKVAWYTREAPASGRAIVDKTGHALFNPSDRHDYDYEDDRKGGEITPSEATDNDIRSLVPHLMIFSFVAKKWGKVHVDQVTDISFRNDAFDKLVLPEEEKKLVLSLVRNSDSSLVSDLIDNKGGGCVLLLHGKPGLGKTLTAEAVAEVLKRPLYAVSVGELGTNPETLEEKLQTVLQTAQRWNAVLLLDEADVFLEARRSGDIDRNAMVGTFLRLLEYYNGVLILTTNRVKDMDQAFYSRISLAIRYNEFNHSSRKQVIQNLLETNGVTLDNESVTRISLMDVNGRQIKNAIRLSRFMARDNQRNVSAKDIMSVLNKLQDFQDSIAE